MDLVYKILRILNGLAVNLENDVAGGESGIVCRAGGANTLNGCAIDVGGNVELRTHVRGQVVDGEAELTALIGSGCPILCHLAGCVKFANLDIDCFRLAIAEDSQSNGVAWGDLAYSYLQGAAVDDPLAVEFAKHVAGLESRLAGRGAGSYLAYNGASCIVKAEEAGVIGRDIVHADAQIAMVHGAGFDDGFGGGFGDLRGNGEACSGERAVVSDDEGVDADQLAMRVNQRAAGVAGVDGGVGLNEITGLARVIGVGIGAIERARRCRA